MGGGRIGGALMDMGAQVLVRRGERVPEGEGPIWVCTRNDDLDAVLQATPPGRQVDLVFLQNGMLEPWLAARGLAENTQALLYFAVARRGDPPEDGGGTVAWGRWAEALVARLARGGIEASAVSRAELRAQAMEKLIWNCTFGLLCEARGVSVGELVRAHRAEVDALSAELEGVARRAEGVELAPGLSDRLCAYSLTIADYKGAVKEWPWRNGWFVAQGSGPLHDRLLAEIGRSLTPGREAGMGTWQVH